MSVLRMWLHVECEGLIRRGRKDLACWNCQEIWVAIHGRGAWRTS